MESKYRSQGERTIADFLEEANLPFEYEAPLSLRHRGKLRIHYPDFYLPDYHHIIEYFGVVGDPGYDRLKRKKATVYRENRIPATFLEPGDMEGRWQEKILDGIEDTLTSRLDDYRKRRSRYRSRKKDPRTNVPVHLE